MSDVIDFFNTACLAHEVEMLSEEAINALPFGCIRLDVHGKVEFVSEKEKLLSGRGQRPAIGLDFFMQIAPCMNTARFKGQIDAAVTRGRLDLELTHVGDFDDRDRELHIRAQSSRAGGVWLFLRRLD